MQLHCVKAATERGMPGAVDVALQHRCDALHDRLEQAAGGKPLAPATIIHAFIGTSLRMIQDEEGGRNFIRLLGRTYTDPAKSIRALLGQLYAPAMARFKDAFARALPKLPAEELVWRLHFMFGTLSYTLAATDTLELIAGCKPEDRYDARVLEERLTAFLGAGLQAPLAPRAGTQSVKQAA